jgi:thioredoxin reductase (NADPH)
MPGGHLANVAQIEDYPGFPQGVPGYELGPSVQEQASEAGAEFALAEAIQLEPTPDGWEVVTDDQRHAARVVIVATGSKPKPLGLPNEDRFFGQGVSHCATCDGPLFRDRAVAVVGGGDSALQEALTLADVAGSVLVLHHGPTLTAQAVYQRRLAEARRVEVRPDCVVDSLHGETSLSAIGVRDVRSGASAEVTVQGLFPYVGLQPRTAFLRNLLPLDVAGHIPTDLWLRTARRGLFAAGDVRQHSAAQAVAAAGDGATAAVAADRYLRSGEWPDEMALAATMRR